MPKLPTTPKKKRRNYSVMTHLKEVVDPQFNAHASNIGRKSKYSRLLNKVQKHPDRWFAVAKFHPASSAPNGSYEYMKPHLVAYRLRKQYGARGFVFKTLRDEHKRLVLVKYSPTNKTKPKKGAVQ